MSDTTDYKAKRPLSPHLQVYKLPLTALLSISHRATGMLLVLGAILIAAFFIAAATSEEAYNMVWSLAETGLGRFILLGWSAAFYYHMCNGLRHMVWDMGFLLDKVPAMKSNYVVLLATILLTLGTWAMACPCWKG